MVVINCQSLCGSVCALYLDIFQFPPFSFLEIYYESLFIDYVIV